MKLSSGQIAAILILAVILSGVIWVIVAYFSQDKCIDCLGLKNIGINCSRSNLTGHAVCTIASADAGINFTRVSVSIYDKNGTEIVQWSSAITYISGKNENKSALTPVFGSKIIDNGDDAFGVGDKIEIVPIKGYSLIGLCIKLRGGGGDGSATII